VGETEVVGELALEQADRFARFAIPVVGGRVRDVLHLELGHPGARHGNTVATHAVRLSTACRAP